MAEPGDEFSSWLESRRLIVAQLASMDAAIRELASKIERFNETSREQSGRISKEAQEAINAMNIRLSLLDQKVKIWSAGIGMVAGAVMAVIMPLIMHGLGK